jgi:hypothetical protein
MRRPTPHRSSNQQRTFAGRCLETFSILFLLPSIVLLCQLRWDVKAAGYPKGPTIESMETLLSQAAGVLNFDDCKSKEYVDAAHSLIEKLRVTHGSAYEDLFWLLLGPRCFICVSA